MAGARVAPPRRLPRLLGLVALLLPLSGQGADAVSDYQVKAAYLFNFTQFIDWPAEAFADATAPFRICVWGDDPFAGALEALQRRRYRDRAIVVEFPADADAARRCHLVYLPGRPALVHERDEALRGHPLLTVSSSEGFASAGGGIEFVTSGERVRMSINIASARAVGLRVSAKLLEVALRVIDRAPTGGAG